MKRKVLTIVFLLLIVSTGFSAETTVIGVRESGTGYAGVTADLRVTVGEGENHVYIDTMPLTEIDTQASARLAQEVACDTVNVNCSDKNFYYVIRGDFPMIGGPSAGAAMTVLTMAELYNHGVSNKVGITGTVNPDGSVGSVGAVLEKAITASEAGIQRFLVPTGQSGEVMNHEFSNGMEVVEVSTVREAYGYFTGVFFQTPEDEVNWTKFNEFMKPMSDDLIKYSNDSFNNLTREYEDCNLTEENTEVLENLINNTNEQFNDMNELYNNGTYYSAASYAVGASINALYGQHLINHFQAEDEDAYINSVVNDLSQDFNQTASLINKDFSINHVNDLESINIAVDRFFEAESLLNESLTYWTGGDYPSTLYSLSFTKVRLETSNNWLTLKDVFENDLNMTFNQDMLKDLALSRIENTNTMITYAESMGSSYYTTTAETHLSNSMSAYNEADYIYSIFESLKSLCNANLGMQLRGLTDSQVSERIALSDKQARQDINMVQSEGFTPILALSYYEYAQNFKQDNPAQALLYLEYSKQFSLLSNQMVGSIQEGKGAGDWFKVEKSVDLGNELSIVLFGVILGVTLTLLLMGRLIL